MDSFHQLNICPLPCLTESVQSGIRCGTRRVGGIHHCHSYEQLFHNASMFKRAFYGNRTAACVKKNRSLALAKAVQIAADRSWEISGDAAFWGYRPP